MDLKGKSVIVMCCNYIYEGILDHETHDRVYLRGAKEGVGPRLVYATGPWASAQRTGKKGTGEIQWRNAETLPVVMLGIERGAIESIGELSI